MTLVEDLRAFVKKTHDDAWARREGRVVPDSSSVKFGTDAVTLDGTVLYADLSDSTGLVKGSKDWFAAEVYKNYLHVAAKIIRSQGGEITAFDGDRVMAVFLGSSKNTSAVKAGLKIKWAVGNILQPALLAKYPKSKYLYKQRVGIDSSALFVAKTGIRGADDLVWVGAAANNAAKMAALHRPESVFITENVYGKLAREAKVGGKPERNMWSDLGATDLGYRIYGSTWHWSL